MAHSILLPLQHDDFEDDNASAKLVTDLTHGDDTESETDNDEIQSQPSTDFTMDPEIAADLERQREEDVKKAKEALMRAEQKAEKKRRADEKKRKADKSTPSSPKTPPQPRKKGRKSDENEKQGSAPKDLNLSVSLQLYMYPTPAEAKKPVKNRTAAKTQIWKFDFADPLSTFEAQLLVRTDDFFKPDNSNIDDYDIAYTIARAAPQPVMLDSEESYVHLVESLKSTSQVVVYVTRKKSDIIDMSNNKENGKKNSKKKKSKVPAERDIDSDDDPVNQNIIALCGQWPCETKSCPSENCWINPETAAHFPLHFKCLERWSMAMLDGPERAMIDSPPNDPLFTTNNEHNSLASHVLQQHQVRRNSTANGSNISINITPKVPHFFVQPLYLLNFPPHHHCYRYTFAAIALS
ncbi:hypothetical protein BDP27DRAFT_1432056 [Rhodocollybia butyracea]|uniref:Uncharacterized protein n=1 Tax=Rhodocollybia butyracea TaxID=206335 RepID=A0A9P5TWY8_9AGAR|nr:hypothetical protein BDP27DRAFT_1432056 [Rhodocollybia butyracea]